MRGGAEGNGGSNAKWYPEFANNVTRRTFVRNAKEAPMEKWAECADFARNEDVGRRKEQNMYVRRREAKCEELSWELAASIAKMQ